MLEASVTGLLRTVFVIIGVFTLLRFIGRLLIAKREQDKMKSLELKGKEIKQAQEQARKNKGNISIHTNTSDFSNGNTVDVDFEET
jgi:hypothetical protein